MESTEVASRPDGTEPPAEPRLSHGPRKLAITPVAAFPHQSRPGYYGITFTDELKERLRVLVTAMIPGGEGYPPAGEAQVVEFLEARSSSEDREWLTDVASRFDGKTDHQRHRRVDQVGGRRTHPLRAASAIRVPRLLLLPPGVGRHDRPRIRLPRGPATTRLRHRPEPAAAAIR